MHVLIVEDQRDFAMALGMYLEIQGHTSIHVTSLEGVRGADPGSFDVALVDLKLPDGSGTEVPALLENTRCIVITGYDREDVWQECAAAGFVDHIRKPVDLDQLAKVLTPA